MEVREQPRALLMREARAGEDRTGPDRTGDLSAGRTCEVYVVRWTTPDSDARLCRAALRLFSFYFGTRANVAGSRGLMWLAPGAFYLDHLA